MPYAKDVVKNLRFEKSKDNIVSYIIKNNANNDIWKTILVVYNSKEEPFNYPLDSEWNLAVIGDSFDMKGKVIIKNVVSIPPIPMLIAFQK